MVNLFLYNYIELDDEDKEANEQYTFFDEYMEQRRKKDKEKKELELLKKKRIEKPTIRQVFSSLKNDLKKMKVGDWENIPEVKRTSYKKRKFDRITPNTDLNILSALNDHIIPLNEGKNDIESLGKAKNNLLKAVIDSVKGNLNNKEIDPKEYNEEIDRLFPESKK